MQKDTLQEATGLLSQNRFLRIWKKIVSILACVVVLCTTYLLILPAITMEKIPQCGKTEHIHSETCYTQVSAQSGTVLASTQEGQLETQQEMQVEPLHTHTDDCYIMERSDLICTISTEPHTHTETCYTVTENLICTIPEGEGHHHDENCLDENDQLVCGLAELDGHYHNAECYEVISELTCPLSEEPHQHTDECYDQKKVLVCELSTETVSTEAPVQGTEQGEQTELTCTIAEGEGAHIHSAESGCYDENGELVCQLAESEGHRHGPLCYGTWELTCQTEEHTHTEECFADTDADTETEEIWKDTLPEQLSGNWAKDLAAVAGSQLGYWESQKNYILDEQGQRRSYTRYGEWYGDPYGDWSAMFVSFCLHYANIPEEAFPWEEDVQRWVEKLSGKTEGYEAFDLYRGTDYAPIPGDLVFFDTDGDGIACHVGIVTEYSPAGEDAPACLKTIEKGAEGDVREVVRELIAPTQEDSLTVLGYAALPENPEERREYRYEDDTVLVTVVLPQDSQTPKDAELRVTLVTQEEERYSLLEQQAREAVGSRLKELVLYDLSFYTGEEEYLPVEDSAAVTVTFKQEVISASGRTVEVLHYTEDADPVALEDVEVHWDENEKLTGLDFKTDGFSVFGVLAAETESPITTTVSPSGTTINLFDYWITQEDEGNLDTSDGRDKLGINRDHALHFTGSGNEATEGKLNKWTGNAGGPLQGIVANRLGSDGYPYLSGNFQVDGSGSTESLAYLFDPTYSGPSAAYRKAFRKVGGLLQIDQDGYYYYDSTKNYAEYDQNSNHFNIYPGWAVTHNSIQGQFFPFDPYDTVLQSTGAGSNDLNHFFGMTMTTRFIQEQGGLTKSGVPMSYEFSGDDDVWIFIDGVLVADVGGIHDPASVQIDFHNGTVTVFKTPGSSNTTTTSFTDIFAGTGVELNNRGVLQDNTYHTLKFYYMERGGYASNLHLKFNLVTFPSSGITKVDQVGDPVSGATFVLYRADENYNIVETICSGVTGSDGEFIFTESSGQPLTLQELYTEKGQYYVLREINIPQGYRGTGADIHLKITEGGVSQDTAGGSVGGSVNVKSYVMTCTNTRDCGAFASPSLQVTAPDVLHLVDGNNTEINLGETPGSLFGIVLKYTGPIGSDKDLRNDANWSPVYGSAAEGYTIVNRKEYPNMAAAVNAARNQYPDNQNYFRLSSSGGYQALIENLPGDIETYNFMAGNDNISKVQYIVSYYWEDSNGKITRVRDYTDTGGDYQFNRTFGTVIHVPNMANRIAVQKLAENGETPLNGAVFAMYRVDDYSDSEQHNERADFYVPNRSVGVPEGQKIHLYLEPDMDENFMGRAKTCFDTDWTGEYSVDSTTGEITVTITGGEDDSRKGTYYITPLEVKTTVAASLNNYKEDGIAEFDKIPPGKYIIRELTAPAGYSINANHIMILVTDNAIYANAGTENDGISVSRGPGYLAGNLHYFATYGDIDNTLTWVYSQMKVSGESSRFTDVNAEEYAGWTYVDKNRYDGTTGAGTLTAFLKYIGSMGGDTSDPATARFSYGVDNDVSKDETISANLTLDRRIYTRTGWSYLEIYQNYGYGSIHHQQAAEYADWRFVPGTAERDDLSNLFSRSVYIHVTDQKQPADLEITKTVKAGDNVEPGNVPSDAQFNFTVTLTKNNEPLAGACTYTVYNIIRNENGVETDRDPVDNMKDLELNFDEEGKATLSLILKDKQAVVIRGIPADAEYDIVETDPGREYTVTAEEKVWKDGGKTTEHHEGGTVTGSMYWQVQDGVLDNLSKVDFTNTYDPAANTISMTVRKVDSANHSKHLSGALFTLKNEDGRYYGEDGEWVDEETAHTTGTDGNIVFTGITDGIYTLTETKAPDGYYPLRSVITITVEGKRITASAGGIPCNVEEDGVTLTVPNSSGYELPATGGSGTTMYTIGGLLLIFAAALLLYKNKKRA